MTANILAFCLQLVLVIGVSALAATVFRLRTPRVALVFWQTILAVCLLLPFVQPWHHALAPVTAVASAAAVPVDEPLARAAFEPSSASGVLDVAQALLIVIACGISLRMLWLTVGAIKLWRLRRAATPLSPLPDAFAVAGSRLGVQADVLVSDRIAGPVTYGLRKPVVILTPDVVAMPSHVQEAIAYHELLHVQRRDWLFELFEEGIRTLLWFHPAVWWLIGRIQLTREQVVDRATIDLTASRERYVEALLAVALTKSPVALVPAPLFLRRSFLKQRVAQILQETTMTTRRLIASLTVSAAAIVFTTAAAVRSFPLEAQSQPSADTGEPVQIVRGGEHLLHGSVPEYPRRAIEQKVEGDVLVDLSLDERGEVTDARVLTGPDELRRAALSSVLQWHYSPASLRSTNVQATLRFHLPAGTEAMKKLLFEKHKEADWKQGEAERAEHVMAELRQALQDQTASAAQKDDWAKELEAQKMLLSKIRADAETREKEAAGSMRLVQIHSEGVPSATVAELVKRAGVSVGDTISKDTAKRVMELASDFDEHLRVEFKRSKDADGLVLLVFNP